MRKTYIVTIFSVPQRGTFAAFQARFNLKKVIKRRSNSKCRVTLKLVRTPWLERAATGRQRGQYSWEDVEGLKIEEVIYDFVTE